MNGFHHLRRRVRVSRGLEPYPARSAWKRSLDYLMYGVALLAPIALLPQIFQIYSTKSGEGVSLATWTMLMFLNVMWATYAIVHRDRQLLFANVLVGLCNLTIVVGLLLY